jgi:hypothetical protein
VNCREELEQALFRRGFSWEIDRGRWIRYPPGNSRGRAVVIAQATVDETAPDEWAPLLDEIDRKIRAIGG